MKIKHFLIIESAVCMLLTGCLSEPDFKPVLDDNGNPLEVQLFNEIQQVPVTRVNDEGFCDGDEVGVYVVNFVDGNPGTLAAEGNQADNVRYTLDEATGVWKPENPVYYYDKVTKVNIYGYYPYADVTDVNAWSFEIAKDQSRDAENGHLGGYEASDFLWAKTETTPTASKVVLQFHHMMAGVNVTLVEGEGFASGEFATIEKAALVTNTKRQTTINFSTGEVTATGEIPTTGTIPYKKGDDFRAIVAPQTVAADTPLFSLTVDGLPYVFSKAEDFTYHAGKLHKFSIKINKKSSGGVEFVLLGQSITAWESENISHDGEAREYVVIHCAEAGKLSEAIAAAGKDHTKVKNMKVTGNVNADDFFFMRDQMTVLQAINMKEVDITDNKIPSSAFANKASLSRFVFPEKICSVGGSAFYGTSLGGSLILPDSIKEIGSSCFYSLETLDGTLHLPDNIETIGDGAFCECSFIGNLVLPLGIKSIGSSAFTNNDGFVGELKLPETLEYIGGSAFMRCKGFTGSLKIPHKITQISSMAFWWCSFDGKLILPDGLVTIEKGAFFNNSFRGELILPATLKSIGGGADNEGAFAGNNFSAIVFSENLTHIGDYAFTDNKRLESINKFPEGLTTISKAAFCDCTNLKEIVFPKSVSVIRENAFRNCFQLSTIASHAQTPPTVYSGAFDGVAKDNFTVEVLETAVENYRTAPGWNEFKRISAHHDFSISRAKMRTLNASETKTLTLRAPADASWKVESCPNWVTVTPSSGTGKQNVTVTVNYMAPSDAGTVTYEQMNSSGYYENVSFAGRRDNVVFLLEGKDYRSTMTVEQYNYAPEGTEIGDGHVIVNHSATKGQHGVNVVFMADCFDAKDISEGKYLTACDEAIGHFFALPPYAQYKDYFNVYTVVGLSPDSGVGTVNTIREARFGSQYGLQGSGKIAPDMATCFEYACKAETVTQDNINKTLIVLIENSTEYDGICYMYGDGSAIALCPMSNDAYPYDFRGIVQHEAGGHGFGKLADEYIYHNAFISTCICTDGCGHVDEFNAMKARGWYDNLSLSGNMYDVPWSHLIFDSKYSNVVDVYEGGYFHTRGVFRSESNSCMNNNVPYYSAISRETIVKRIMEYAGEEYTFEKFKENDVTTSGPTRSIDGSVLDGMAFPARQQHGPVYMGDKPEFSK